MPIKVTCACGQSFAANDALAGKRVKCPKCAQPLQIPGAAAAAPPAKPAAAGAAPPSRPPQPRPQQPAAPAPAPMASVFDEIGLTVQQVTTGPTCPNCRSAMAPGAILCVQCGFNQKLGRVMQTMTTSGPVGMPGGGGGHGHGDVASKLMERAAQTLAEDEESERTKTSEGFPWYGYAGMLIGALCFMVAMRMVPHDSALAVSALVVYFACQLVSLYANIRILIAAFTEGPLHGVLCLFTCGWYNLYYIITRWDTVGSYFLLSLGAGFVGALAFAGAIAANKFKSSATEDVRLLLEPPGIVLVDLQSGYSPALVPVRI